LQLDDDSNAFSLDCALRQPCASRQQGRVLEKEFGIMIRKSTILVITAIAVAGIASSASADVLQPSFGTGDSSPYHYNSNGKLVPGMTVLNDKTTTRHSGYSAYAKVPRKRK
jgi:hypothetical protein